MCLMNSVLCPYLDNFVIVFIDDILRYSKNEEENVEHLATVLILLIEHQLYVNLSKSSFFQTEVHYLGHIISKESIEVNLENIRAIMEWETPRNVVEVRSFMGIASYYKRFNKNSHGLPMILLHHSRGKERNLNGKRNVQQVLSS